MIINTEDIKNAANIEDVIGSLIELKHKGKDYKGCCPFHDEKTPSFSVSPSKGMFKCFGCDEGGDVFTFVMKHEHLSFTEAVEFVAHFTNVIPEYKNESSEEKDYRQQFKAQAKLHKEAIQKAHTFYFNLTWRNTAFIPESDFVLLNNRRYLKSTLQKFGVSIVEDVEQPKNWQLLYNKFQGKLEFSNLQDLGIIAKSNKSKFQYDFFHNRILFPIHNADGHLIAFAGRVTDNSKPKYINSPESSIYEKGTQLYGLHLSKGEIVKKKFVYLVEGYTDVMSMYEYGIQNVAGKCGSSLTLAQAKLLKRYTNTVTMLYDGDTAGIKAAEKDIEILLEAGIQQVNYLPLPHGSDPDDCIREYGQRGFKVYADTKKVDAITWLVDKSLPNKDDIHEKQLACNLAVDLLMYYKKDMIVEMYINKLANVKILNVKVKDLRKLYDDRFNKIQEQDNTNLTPTQQKSIAKYGIYEHRNSIYVYNQNTNNNFQITNFVIEPIMLIRYADKAKRVLRITNEFNHSFLTSVDSNAFINMRAFWEIVTSRGNFSYMEWAKTEHHVKIQRKVISEMKGCFPVEILGYQREGFYAWANGITDMEGRFFEVDQYGMIDYNSQKFYLPFNSKIDHDLRQEDKETELDFHKFHVYPNTKPELSWYEFTKQLDQVFYKGEAQLVIAWYLAALFKDIIYKKVGNFPHLDFFGDAGSGKSALAKLVVSMFGGLHADDKQMNTLNLKNITIPGFYAKLMQFKNGVVWADELNNDVSIEIIEAIKGAFDGTGKNKRKDGKDFNTVQTKVSSALVLSGQKRPTSDIALLERCIAFVIDYKNESTEQQDKFNDLREKIEAGSYTYYSAYFQKYRDYIKNEFTHNFNKVKSLMKEDLEKHSVPNRMISNFAIPLTIMKMLRVKEDFGYLYNDLYGYAQRILIDNVRSVETEGDAGKFWQVFDHLIGKSLIKDDVDYKVKYQSSVKLVPHRSHDNQSKEIPIKDNTPILYIRLRTIYGYYKEIEQTGTTKAMSKSDLGEYLKSKAYYLGTSKGTKFKSNEKTYPAMAFDLSKIDTVLNNEDTEKEQLEIFNT